MVVSALILSFLVTGIMEIGRIQGKKDAVKEQEKQERELASKKDEVKENGNENKQ